MVWRVTITALLGSCLSAAAGAQGIDVVFKVDESGSMGGEINAIKANVNTIASSLPSGSHAAAVGFGASSGATHTSTRSSTSTTATIPWPAFRRSPRARSTTSTMSR